MKRILLALFLFASFAAFAQPQQFPNGRHGGMPAPAAVPSQFKKVNSTASVIILNIPDIEAGETLLKRTATYAKLYDNRDIKTLSLYWTIKYYSVDTAGNIGTYMGNIFSDRTKIFTATNNVMVNPATGQVLTADLNGNYSMNYIGQYDFFNSISDNVAIKLSDIIKQYGITANWN